MLQLYNVGLCKQRHLSLRFLLFSYLFHYICQDGFVYICISDDVSIIACRCVCVSVCVCERERDVLVCTLVEYILYTCAGL